MNPLPISPNLVIAGLYMVLVILREERKGRGGEKRVCVCVGGGGGGEVGRGQREGVRLGEGGGENGEGEKREEEVWEVNSVKCNGHNISNMCIAFFSCIMSSWM